MSMRIFCSGYLRASDGDDLTWLLTKIARESEIFQANSERARNKADCATALGVVDALWLNFLIMYVYVDFTDYCIHKKKH